MHLVVGAGNVGRLGKGGIRLTVGLRGRVADERRARLLAVDGGRPYRSRVIGRRPGAARTSLGAGPTAGERLGARRDARERLPRTDPGLGDAREGPVKEGQKASRQLGAAEGGIARVVRPMGAGGSGGRGLGTRGGSPRRRTGGGSGAGGADTLTGGLRAGCCFGR